MKEGRIARARRATLDAAESRSEGGGYVPAMSRGGGSQPTTSRSKAASPPSWGDTIKRIVTTRTPRK